MNKLVILLIIISTCLWGALIRRTIIADYDVKQIHYEMDSKYCPFCGERLKK